MRIITRAHIEASCEALGKLPLMREWTFSDGSDVILPQSQQTAFPNWHNDRQCCRRRLLAGGTGHLPNVLARYVLLDWQSPAASQGISKLLHRSSSLALAKESSALRSAAEGGASHSFHDLQGSGEAANASGAAPPTSGRWPGLWYDRVHYDYEPDCVRQPPSTSPEAHEVCTARMPTTSLNPSLPLWYWVIDEPQNLTPYLRSDNRVQPLPKLYRRTKARRCTNGNTGPFSGPHIRLVVLHLFTSREALGDQLVDDYPISGPLQGTRTADWLPSPLD
ncbi:hypothetical protein BKA70DRAFT_1400653 [Coprinopsis sp. MPI-PUGE-AT-0042]|nr:hypothetical protein BKA70DRAFT_1400653 [Coprinopsis sp. MPI-PUGE-AT-0042]